ncbi:hypothetical protein ACOMCU_22005 [Lysinibacillus sp. UGB7]|uniref:hypothetical protein n=1 Tax=Lysinibacillus sp. UGB7 TaxID=3411039 RepID=UPI003B76D36B
MKQFWLILAVIVALIITIFFGHFWIVFIRFAVMIIFSPITWVILIVLYFVSKRLRG